MTLIELIVSLALLSVTVLTLASLLVQNTRRVVIGQNDARLSSDIQEFSNALETYLSNATRILTCGCNARCVYTNNATNPPECESDLGCAKASASVPTNYLLDFETENANDPSVQTGAGCLATRDLGNNFVPRGCKKRIRLRYTPPEKITTGTPNNVGLPGRLEVLDDNNVVLHTLLGVYSLRCGQTPANPTAAAGSMRAAGTEFHLEIAAKARANQMNAGTTLNDIEGWSATDSNNPNFRMGTHRKFKATIQLRNIAAPGIHFGKGLTFITCFEDGDSAPDGNCCSGYRRVDGTCMRAEDCTPTGQVPPGGTGPWAWGECCSHKTETGGTGRCL